MRRIPLYLVLGLLFSSCYLKERIMESVGRHESADNRFIKARNAANMTTDCCWCFMKTFKENEVNPYVSRALCEDLSQARNADCKKVKILGGSCSFLNVSGGGMAMNCDVRSLQYIDGDKTGVIEPPSGEMGPCYEDRSLPEFGRKPAKKDEKEAFQGPKCEWVCGRDPMDRGHCRATVFEMGVSRFRESLPLPEGHTCDRSVCSQLFAEKFYELCPTFDGRECETN